MNKKLLDDSKIQKGFRLEELFQLVNDVKKRAKNGDKDSKSILDSASKNWGLYSKYVV